MIYLFFESIMLSPFLIRLRESILDLLVCSANLLTDVVSSSFKSIKIRNVTNIVHTFALGRVHPRQQPA